ncbi:ribosome biogenesis GTP-binding protein YihA/YsxC [soil metagenome]
MNIRSARFAIGAARWSGLPESGLPEIAFVGRSNVGKSSLLNMLVGRRALARTSNTPGKTQEFNYYLINEERSSDAFYMVDLPGYGFAKVSKEQRASWQRLIGQYITEREPLRVVFHLIDSRHPPQKADEEVIELMRGGVVPYVIVLTKSDKLSRNEIHKRVSETAKTLEARGIEAPIVLTSAAKREGAKELWRWAELFLKGD